MRFLFDCAFYTIAFIVLLLFIFYKPRATGILLAVFATIVVALSALILIYRHKKRK